MPTQERRVLSVPSVEKKKERTPREEVDAILADIKARWKPEDAASFALLLKVFEHSIPDAIHLASDVGLDARGYRYLVGHGLPRIDTKHGNVRDLVYEEIEALKKRGLRSETSSPAISIGAAPPETVSRIETAYAHVLAERAKGMNLKQLNDLPVMTDEEDATYRLAAAHLNRVTDVWQGVMTVQDARAMFHRYGLDQDPELVKKFFSNRVDEVATNEVMEALRGYLPEKTFDANSLKITEELNTRRVKLTAPIYAVEKMEAEQRLKGILNQKLSASGQEVALDEKGEYVVRKKVGVKEEKSTIDKEPPVKWKVMEVGGDDPETHSYHELPDGELVDMTRSNGKLLIDIEGFRVKAIDIGSDTIVNFRPDIPAVVLKDNAEIRLVSIVHEDGGRWKCQITTFPGQEETFERTYPKGFPKNFATPLNQNNYPFSTPDWKSSVALYMIDGQSYFEYVDPNGVEHLARKGGQNIFRTLKDDQGNLITTRVYARLVVTRAGALISGEHQGSHYVWDMKGNIVTKVHVGSGRGRSWVLRGQQDDTVLELHDVLASGKVAQRFIIRPKRTEGTAEKREWKPTAPAWVEMKPRAYPFRGISVYELPDGSLLTIVADDLTNDLLAEIDGEAVVTCGEESSLSYRPDPPTLLLADDLSRVYRSVPLVQGSDGKWGKSAFATWKTEAELTHQFPKKPKQNQEIRIDSKTPPFEVPNWSPPGTLFTLGHRRFLSYYDDKNHQYRIVDDTGVDRAKIVHDEHGNAVDVFIGPSGMHVNESGALFCGESPSRKQFIVWDVHGNIVLKRKAKGGLELYINHDSEDSSFRLSYRDAVDDSLIERIRVVPNPARVREEKPTEVEVVDHEIEDSLTLLNAVHDPKDREQLRKLSGLWDTKLAHAPKRIWNAEAMRRAMVEDSKKFLKTIPAVPDDAPKHLAHQLVMRMFPEMFRTELHGKGLGGRLRDWWKSEKPDPRGALRVRGETALRGGGVETLKDSRTVLELREPMRGFLATGMYGACGKENGVWKELDFPLQREKNASSVVTAVVPNAGELGRAVLPTPLDGEVIAERVKVQMKKGERALEVDRRPTGIHEATIPTDAKTLGYTFTAGPEQPLKDASKMEMDRFLKMLSDISPDVAQDLKSVPARIPQAFLVGLFTPEFKKLAPKEQVVSIERFVRENGFYDIHNEAVSETKVGKPLDEQWAICQDRARSLKAGKSFAGVCADYAGLTTALLRKAGFAAGVVEGYGVDGKEVRVKDSHAAAFVLWPDAHGRPRAVLVDGTPRSTEVVARHVAMPSMEEREKKAEGEGGAVFEESVKKLEALERALQSDDPTALRGLWNGKLEHAVNAILGAVRPGHARAVRALLDGYWYSPLAHMDPSKPGFREALVGGLQGVLAYEREHTPVNEDGDKTAGRTAFIAIEDFADRLVKSHTVRSSADAYRAVREIVDLAMPILEKDERRVFEAVTAYLEAKKMFG